MSRIATNFCQNATFISRTLFYTDSIIKRINRLVKINKWKGFCISSRFPTNSTIFCNASKNFIWISLGICPDCNVYHSNNISQEDNTADHITTFSIGLIHRPILYIFKIRLLFLFFFCSHLNIMNC